MNTLNFKTYDEFVKDKKNEILDLIDYDEKLEIYIKYCKTKDNCYLSSHNNTEEPIELVFEGNLNDLAQNTPHKTYSAIKTLDDKFTDNALIDFTMDYINVDFEDLYNTYVRNVIEDAKESMLPKDFLNALTEYLIDDMKEKYPVVYNNIYYGYSYYTPYTTNEKDLKESNVKFIVKGLKGLRYLKDFNIKDNNNKLER